ncbi:putative bifunctional diguanylate cyclase/phosphodiesterase [Pseudomarimonas salicorniae]|uniref:EAL domain-containing protein n=1 Tax=Pseudomarimonas salicorniae TaxID=2933270 RepID=A0ABT0GH37_9GAMM|nr:GGDEF domain-containing phosphodiesterase [Lysobacter sp. CAU 1642]MCK7593743.1 EAL domain-containing protein [Lysobacter sp. CAU 1642]
MSKAPADPDSTSAACERRLDRERSARKQAESLLVEKSKDLYETLQMSRELQQTLQLALWASGDAMWEWAPGEDVLRVTRFHHLNHRGETTLGSLDELLLQRVEQEDAARLRDAALALRDGLSDTLDVAIALLPDEDTGIALYRRVRGRAVERDDEGRALRCLGTLKDITELRQSERSLRLLGHAFATNRDGLAVLDGDWRILEANEALERMLAADGRPLAGLQALEFLDQSALDLPRLKKSGSMHCETTLGGLDGSMLPVELNVSSLAAGQGHAALFLLSVRDISDRHHSQRRLEQMTLFDGLTGLPNRLSLERKLDAVLPDVEEQNEAALLFVDIDGFKTVNDGLGYAAGDELLGEVALRLKGWVGQGDYVARWGADEFCVLTRAAQARDRAERLARRLLDVLSEPMDIKEHRLQVTASIGIALAPEHADSPELLLKLADRAMHQAKRRGRAGFAFHQGDRDSAGLRELEVLGALRHDLEHQRLRMAAQCKVDRDGREIGYETLVRWTHELLGPVSPAEFIPLAERNGLINRIGEVTINQSLAFASRLQAQGLEFEVAINLSPHQLGDAATLDLLRRACRRHKVPAHRINLEITESAVIDDPQVAADLLMAFRGEGFGVALDDFGIGYSSLAYLRLLPLDKVKIDRSFMTDAVDQLQARALLQGIVDLCHTLGLKVVAEGVETEAQATLLRELQVDEMQGFLFGRPILVDDLLSQIGAG